MSSARPAITLLGAAGEVTGSCSLVEAGRSRIVVDCGMIRGSWEDEQRNLTLPKIDWRWVDAVVLAHVAARPAHRVLPRLCPGPLP